MALKIFRFPWTASQNFEGKKLVEAKYYISNDNNKIRNGNKAENKE